MNGDSLLLFTGPPHTVEEKILIRAGDLLVVLIIEQRRGGNPNHMALCAVRQGLRGRRGQGKGPRLIPLFLLVRLHAISGQLGIGLVGGGQQRAHR